jgi:hypothetical protein
VAGVAWNLLTVGLSSALALSVFLITSRVLTPRISAPSRWPPRWCDGVDADPVAFGEALIQRRSCGAPSRQRVLADRRDRRRFLCGPGPVRRAAGALDGGPTSWPTILPVLGLRILFDATAAVPAPLVARRMQFRYTALRGRFWPTRWRRPLRRAGAGGLRALGAGPVADRQCLRGDGGVGVRGALAAGAGCPPRRCASCAPSGFTRWGAGSSPGAARPFASGRGLGAPRWASTTSPSGCSRCWAT